MRVVPVLAAAIAATTLVLPSFAQCPSWDPRFATPQPGTGGIEAMEVFDDGTGPALYVGGFFQAAGGVPAKYLARYDGEVWSSVGSPVDGLSYWVNDLAVFDDGSGPALFVSGQFWMAGGQPANHIAKWDGTSWSTLGSGIPGGTIVEVPALAVFDDGSGPALYVGGGFGTAGGVSVKNIARWNGTSWSAVGGPNNGVSSMVESLEVFDDGSGPALYVGGHFSSAGGISASRIARWNGTAWSSVGGVAFTDEVEALEVHDDGTGPALYASTGPEIARWNGVAWSTVGTVGGSVFAHAETLHVFDDGSGPRLYAGGSFSTINSTTAHNVASWDGMSWSPVGSPVEGTNGIVMEFAVFDGGSGPRLCLAAGFGFAGGMLTGGVARWDGTTWSGTNPTGVGLSNEVAAFATYDDGNGRALFAGGRVSTPSGPGHRVVRWNGATWSKVGLSGGSFPWFGEVFALSEFANELYAGGSFITAAGVDALNIARWDSSAWLPLGAPGGGTDAAVRALTTFDDGTGTALYVGGEFTSADGVATSHVARWNTASWSALGAGVDGNVLALSVFDDGSGAALYVGGEFANAGGVPASNVARWDGTSWSDLAGGVDGAVRAFTVFDDGSGAALYVGGDFTNAGGVTAPRVARWDGTSWSALASGTDGSVDALTVHDDGAGAALHAGGTFTTAGGLPANRIARWDGASWSAVGSPGIEGVQSGTKVAALLSFDDGVEGGPELYVGGRFTQAGGSPSFYVARWGNCASVPAFCFGDGSSGACPCGNSGLAGHGCENAAGTGGALLASTGSALSDTLVLSQSGEPTNSLSIFLQGSVELASPVVFGDGLRCAGGALKRLYVANAVGGAVSAPGPGDLSIRAQSAALGDPLVPGAVRVYQVHYRDPTLGFCPAPPGNSFNVGNALRVTW